MFVVDFVHRSIMFHMDCKHSEISFQITNQDFKSQIKFLNHKSSAKSVSLQIMNTKYTCDGPLNAIHHDSIAIYNLIIYKLLNG